MQQSKPAPECPCTPPSSTEAKCPMTTGARVVLRLNKVLDSVEKPNFDINDEDLTFNTSTATAAGGGMNMTLLGEMSRLEDISRVVGVVGQDHDVTDGDVTLLGGGDFSFQVDEPLEVVKRQESFRGVKRAMDNTAAISKRRKVVPAYDGSVPAYGGSVTTPGNFPTGSFAATPPTSKRKKPIAVLTEMKKTIRKTASKKSPGRLELASTQKVKLRLLSRSGSRLFTEDIPPMTSTKPSRKPRAFQSIKKPNFGCEDSKIENEDDDDDVSPKTARRVKKSVTKTLSTSLRVSSTSSIDVEAFWRQLSDDDAFKNLSRKRFDGIIANLHNKNRCFVSNNVIHRI